MGKYDKDSVNEQPQQKSYVDMNKYEKENFKKQIVEEKKRKGEELPWWFDDGSEQRVVPKVEEPVAEPIGEEPAPVPVAEPVAEEPVAEEPAATEDKEEPKPAKRAPAKKKTAPARKAPAKKKAAKKGKDTETAQQVVTVVAPAPVQGAVGYGQYCKFCGRLIPWDSNFCPACGQKLEAPVKPEESKGVKFAEEERKTFAEQLAALKKKDRALYDDLVSYALKKDEARQSDAKFAVTVIVGRYKLIQIMFQRGKLVARFMTASSDFKKYSAQEKAVKIKERPTVVEIDSEESVAAAKNLIDITYNNIQEARGK